MRLTFFASYLLALLALVAGCSFDQTSKEGDSDASEAFYLDQVNLESVSTLVHFDDTDKTKVAKLFNLKFCFIDPLSTVAIQAEPFTVRFNEKDEVHNTDVTGCFRKSVTMSYNRLLDQNQGTFVKLTMDVMGGKNYPGQVRLELAIDPWQENLTDLRFGEVAAIKTASEVGVRFLTDSNAAVAEDEADGFEQKGYDLIVEQIEWVPRRNLNNGRFDQLSCDLFISITIQRELADGTIKKVPIDEGAFYLDLKVAASGSDGLEMIAKSSGEDATIVQSQRLHFKDVLITQLADLDSWTMADIYIKLRSEKTTVPLNTWYGSTILGNDGFSSRARGNAEVEDAEVFESINEPQEVDFDNTPYMVLKDYRYDQVSHANRKSIEVNRCLDLTYNNFFYLHISPQIKMVRSLRQPYTIADTLPQYPTGTRFDMRVVAIASTHVGRGHVVDRESIEKFRFLSYFQTEVELDDHGRIAAPILYSYDLVEKPLLFSNLMFVLELRPLDEDSLVVKPLRISFGVDVTKPYAQSPVIKKVKPEIEFLVSKLMVSPYSLKNVYLDSRFKQHAGVDDREFIFKKPRLEDGGGSPYDYFLAKTRLKYNRGTFVKIDLDEDPVPDAYSKKGFGEEELRLLIDNVDGYHQNIGPGYLMKLCKLYMTRWMKQTFEDKKPGLDWLGVLCPNEENLEHSFIISKAYFVDELLEPARYIRSDYDRLDIINAYFRDVTQTQVESSGYREASGTEQKLGFELEAGIATPSFSGDDNRNSLRRFAKGVFQGQAGHWWKWSQMNYERTETANNDRIVDAFRGRESKSIAVWMDEIEIKARGKVCLILEPHKDALRNLPDDKKDEINDKAVVICKKVDHFVQKERYYYMANWFQADKLEYDEAVKMLSESNFLQMVRGLRNFQWQKDRIVAVIGEHAHQFTRLNMFKTGSDHLINEYYARRELSTDIENEFVSNGYMRVLESMFGKDNISSHLRDSDHLDRQRKLAEFQRQNKKGDYIPFHLLYIDDKTGVLPGAIVR